MQDRVGARVERSLPGADYPDATQVVVARRKLTVGAVHLGVRELGITEPLRHGWRESGHLATRHIPHPRDATWSATRLFAPRGAWPH